MHWRYYTYPGASVEGGQQATLHMPSSKAIIDTMSITMQADAKYTAVTVDTT